jgi:hypothetical protein
VLSLRAETECKRVSVIGSFTEAKSPQDSGDLGEQPGLKLDGWSLENQRGLAISSERGRLLPGLCRIA